MHDGNEGLTRRRLLEAGAVAAAASALAPLSSAWGAKPAAATRWPAGRVSGGAAQRVVPRQFLPKRQLETWHGELDGRGLRATGSTAHERYVDTLADRLQRAGVEHVHFESAPMRRWTPSKWGLDIVGGPAAGPVKTASYIPYSGQLPAAGVTGALTYVAASATVAPGSLAGKVALFDVGLPPITIGLFTAFGLPGKSYDPHHAIDPSKPFLRSWIGDFSQRLAQLQEGNPAAVIGIIPINYAEALGSYFPYDGAIRKVPGVYVAIEAGATLKGLADTGQQVHVTLTAKVDDVKTRNVVGLIPGRSDELVVLHSHTDGTNGIEDNGPDVIVAMAQYLARIPKGELPRTIMVLMTSGHFAGGVGALAWTRRHKHDTIPRIAAAITVEHVGANAWTLNADGSTTPSTDPEIGAFFQPGSAALADAALNGIRSSAAAPGFVANPLTPKPPSTSVAAWPGEGQYLWNDAGIAVANYITGPSYLLNAGADTLHRVDVDRVRRTAIGFTDMALALTRVPKAKLKVPLPGD